LDHDTDGTDERPLLTNASYSFTTPQFAPDGKHLVLLGEQNDQPTYRQTMLTICDVDGTHLTWLTKDGDAYVQQPRIAKSGDVYFVRPFHGGARLEQLNLQSREDSTLVDGPVGVSALMGHMLRIIEFFERYSENTRTTPVTSPTQ
jgi:Tol biopolymer transport system component